MLTYESKCSSKKQCAINAISQLIRTLLNNHQYLFLVQLYSIDFYHSKKPLQPFDIYIPVTFFFVSLRILITLFYHIIFIYFFFFVHSQSALSIYQIIIAGSTMSTKKCRHLGFIPSLCSKTSTKAMYYL